MAKNLFVGSLPFSTTEDSIRTLFSQFGQVVSANIIVDKYSGQSRGFAFVEMGTDEEAKQAIEKLDGTSFEGRSIVVKEALPKPSYRGSTNQRNFSDRNFRGGKRGGGSFNKRW